MTYDPNQPYSQQPYGNNPYAKDPHGQQQPPADPYAEQPYSGDPYADPYGQSYQQDGYDQNQPYTGAGYPGGYPPPRKTNGMALASMIVSIASIPTGTCVIAGVVGAILGHAAQKQIAESGDEGAGFAKAGIIVGWSAFALGLLGTILYVLLIALGVWAGLNEPTTTY